MKWGEIFHRVEAGARVMRESFAKFDCVYMMPRKHLAPKGACCGRETITPLMVKYLGEAGLVQSSHLCEFFNGELTFYPMNHYFDGDDWVEC